jgi:hypothetical protein
VPGRTGQPGGQDDSAAELMLCKLRGKATSAPPAAPLARGTALRQSRVRTSLAAQSATATATNSRSKDRQGCAYFHHKARNGLRIALFCCVEEARLLRNRVPYSLDAIGSEDGEQLLRSCRRCKVSQLSRSQVWAVLLRNCKSGSWSSWSSKTRVPTLPRTYSYSCQRTCVDAMTERSPCSYRTLNC